MTLPPDRTRVAIEQMLAFGRSDAYIRKNLRVSDVTITKVRLYLDEINYDPDAEALAPKCPAGHPLTIENLAPRTDGRRECLTCKKDRQRDYDRNRRPRKKAA